MSYLLQYARHPDSIASRRPAARVNEQHSPEPPAECTNTINLEFSLETAQLRENSLFKVDALLGALHRFRVGLAAQAELAARRHHQPNP